MANSCLQAAMGLFADVSFLSAAGNTASLPGNQKKLLKHLQKLNR